jgi:hypothetical protein
MRTPALGGYVYLSLVFQQSPSSLQTIAADALVAPKPKRPSVTTPAVSRCFIVDLLLFFGRGLKTLRRRNGSSLIKQTARTWIKLAEELEQTQAFLAAIEDETEPERQTG